MPPLRASPTSARYSSNRDKRLAASDWAMLPDAPTDKPAWEVYRQALRDLPQQPGFPDAVTWPAAPA